MVMEAHRFRLSVMMFGQYVVMGTWAVTLSTYLMSSPTEGGLNFPPADVAWIYSTLALAAIIAPVFTGLLADRLFPADRLLAVVHMLGAVLLAAAGWWCFVQQPRIAAAFRIDDSAELARLIEETFLPLFLLMLAYSFCNVTGMTLTNVVAFRNLHDPDRSFGSVRLYGTVGWMAGGIQLEMFWNTISAQQLFAAAGLALGVGLFCLCLPRTPPSGRSKSLSEAFGLPALSIFRDNSVRVVIACALGMAVVQQFYGVYSNRYLTQLRVPYPAAVQTVAQLAEAICMMLSPYMLFRFGLKATLAVGLFAWIVRNFIFATEWLPVVIIVGLPLHGLSYGFFVMVASMYIDRKAPLRLRASAQAIFTFVTMGAGMLLGNWFSARVVEAATVGGEIDWARVWLVPACVAAVIFLLYLALFRESATRPLLSPAHARS
jgi:nucleoside transporter